MINNKICPRKTISPGVIPPKKKEIRTPRYKKKKTVIWPKID